MPRESTRRERDRQQHHSPKEAWRPKGKDISLGEAIAMRRQQLEKPGGRNLRPVQERARAHRKTGKFDHFAGRDRVQVDAAGAGSGAGASRPTKPRAPQGNRPRKGSTDRQQQKPRERKPDRKYPLDELRRARRDKKLERLGVDPARIEDFLADEDFRRAFKMTREQFILKPRWKQQALKRGVDLF